jgi:hypothetical protein
MARAVRKFLICGALGALLSGPVAGTAGCSSKTDVNLTGAVHKGPFVLGSTIAVSPLDEAANPTGQTFLTQTTNDKGEFNVAFSASGQVALEGVGFYYNEVGGALSGAPLTLRALYVIQQEGTQSAFINLVTHLTFLRVKKLVKDGAAFSAAVAQAETELRTQLAITLPNFDPGAPGIGMNLLGGDTPANQYLLAVSAVLLQAAGSDAGLQELSNTLATNLEPSGTLSAGNKDKIKAGLLALDTKKVKSNLTKRFMDLGSDAVVPDLDKVVDQDGDGLTTDKDNCPSKANADQKNVDGDEKGDACDVCPLTKCDQDEIDVCKAPQLNGDAGLCITHCVNANQLGGECTAQSLCSNYPAPPKGDEQYISEGNVCLAACSPITPTCLPGWNCQYLPGGSVAMEGFWCHPHLSTLPSVAGATCDPTNGGCDSGFQCIFNKCYPICNLTAPSCPSGACQSLLAVDSRFVNSPPNVGICGPVTK